VSAGSTAGDEVIGSVVVNFQIRPKARARRIR
jgi:hypothetical protein